MKTIKPITMLACLVLLIAGRTVSPNYGVGDTVSDFKLKNVDGKMVALSDYKSSKGVIVIFDCNTCPVSRAYNERIMALNKKYAAKGFPIITINSNDPESSSGDSFQEMIDVAKRKKYDFPYLVDETQNVAKAFGATNTPHVFVLKRESDSFNVVYIGAIDNNQRDASAADKKYVEAAVDAILAGQSVPTTKTKAIGCGIKWKNA